MKKKGVVVLVVVLAATLFVMWRLEQTKNGICKDTGRVLTGQELRHAVLKNMVMLEVEANSVRERIQCDGVYRIGIVRNPKEFNIRTLIDRTHGNELSFEENFAVEMIAPGKTGFDVNRLKEPFMLVGYSTDTRGRTHIIASPGVRQVEPPARVKELFNLWLYDRFRGFGTYYFRYKGTFFDRNCCDNRKHRLSHEEYLKRKYQAYQSTLESFARKIAQHDSFIAVSTCGDILTRKSENGYNQDVMKTIGWRDEQ